MQTVDHNNIKMRSTFTDNQKPYDFCTARTKTINSRSFIRGLFCDINETKSKYKTDPIGRRLSKIALLLFMLSLLFLFVIRRFTFVENLYLNMC